MADAGDLPDLSLPPGVPRHYSVAFEYVVPERYRLAGRGTHKRQAIKAFHRTLREDPRLLAEAQRLMPDLVPGVARTPAGWTWEHVVSRNAQGRVGVMHLMPVVQNRDPRLQYTLMPSGYGGYAEWGRIGPPHPTGEQVRHVAIARQLGIVGPHEPVIGAPLPPPPPRPVPAARAAPASSTGGDSTTTSTTSTTSTSGSTSSTRSGVAPAGRGAAPAPARPTPPGVGRPGRRGGTAPTRPSPARPGRGRRPPRPRRGGRRRPVRDGRKRVGKELRKRGTQAATGGWLTPRRILLILATLAVAALALVLLLAMIADSAADAARRLPLIGSVLGEDSFGVAPGTEAVADIPPELLALYREAGQAQGIDWAILAGIGKVECDHGRSQLAGCNPPGTVNPEGARGPMQFLGDTWHRDEPRFEPDVARAPVAPGQEHEGYATDANRNGTADPWEPADAVHGAARLLRHNGAPERNEDAIHSYNRSRQYVTDVLRWAETYRSATATGPGAPPAAGELATVGGGITVDGSIAGNVQGLLDEAAAAGFTLTGSGYRSHQRQIELRRQNCGPSDYAIYQMPSSQCSPPTARPGSSMHEVGLAIDVSCNGTLIESRSSACFRWMAAHAPSFGLLNLPSEPWHWSVNGN